MIKSVVKFFILIFAAASPLFAVGEKTVSLGGTAGWEKVMDMRRIEQFNGARPAPVLLLSSKVEKQDAETQDMYISFDESDPARWKDHALHYTLRAGGSIQRADGKWARLGGGAAVFTGQSSVSMNSGGEPLVITANRQDALFQAGRRLGSWSIEFWVYPNGMETGEELISWTASDRSVGNEQSSRVQTIILTVYKNRLHWNFTNFFISPDNSKSHNVTLDASNPLVPKEWSHHLIRFDDESGFFEYLVNGIPETSTFVTTTKAEGGEIWNARVGERGYFMLGQHFNGMFDEFRIHNKFVEMPAIKRYPAEGGRFESVPVDLGECNSAIEQIDISGGRVRINGKNIQNEFVRNGNFNFADDSQVQFFARTANTASGVEKEKWEPFNAGHLRSPLKGRYVQVGAVLYPSGNLEATPYIDEIKIVYKSKGPPKPPPRVTAIAGDLSVELKWKLSEEQDLGGYLVYYGTESGVYFGDESLSGASPIDVGKRSSITIDNLKNGTLYYFAVSAYDNMDFMVPGELSREVSARPLRTAE
ncbi:hypothetical protein AGMMS50212_15120 [Spirochaetia bacterium]|nr:hypothetical protein AGMMS50212_15120 [Spirochaetia bacterium]